MKKTTLAVTTLVGTSLSAYSSTILLNENFEYGSINGSIMNWTEIGDDLFGGIGTEPNGADTENDWAYMQINESSSAGFFRSVAVGGTSGETISVNLDFGGNNNSGNLYTGAMTVSLWDGSPDGGGVQLASIVPANPAAGVITPVSLSHDLVSDTAGDLYVQINAGVSQPGSEFDQPLIDNLVVSSVPEPSTALLGGLGLLCLIRRRR